MDMGGLKTDQFAPVVHRFEPIFKHIFPISFPDEVFDLHLFEFNDPKHEVTRRDLIAESLPDLGDAKGDAHPHCIHNIFIVEEDRLGCFWA